MAGLGLAPLGISPYGLGTPATAPEPGGVMLDDGTGMQTGSRCIDEGTGRYTFNAYGRAIGMSNARQRVLLAISTVKGSSAVSALGQQLAQIQDIDAAFDLRVRSVFERALKHLVDDGTIALVAVQIARFASPGTSQDKGARIHVRWRDLTDPKKPEHTEVIG